jgi:hypothetical protein
MSDAMEGRAHIPRTVGTTAAVAVAAFGLVFVVGAGLAFALGYVSALELAVIWALIAGGLSLYTDPPGARRWWRAALWALAALLLGGLPILYLAWRVAIRRTAQEPNVSR